jgi:hypothetical protein
MPASSHGRKKGRNSIGWPSWPIEQRPVFAGGARDRAGFPSAAGRGMFE